MSFWGVYRSFFFLVLPSFFFFIEFCFVFSFSCLNHLECILVYGMSYEALSSFSSATVTHFSLAFLL